MSWVKAKTIEIVYDEKEDVYSALAAITEGPHRHFNLEFKFSADAAAECSLAVYRQAMNMSLGLEHQFCRDLGVAMLCQDGEFWVAEPWVEEIVRQAVGCVARDLVIHWTKKTEGDVTLVDAKNIRFSCGVE